MSGEKKRCLKQDLNSLGTDDISSFMESLPPDFLVVLRTDGILRSILGNLGAPRHVRLLAYAKCAMYGLEEQSKSESGAINRMFLRVKTHVGYLHLRRGCWRNVVISGIRPSTIETDAPGDRQCSDPEVAQVCQRGPGRRPSDKYVWSKLLATLVRLYD